MTNSSSKFKENGKTVCIIRVGKRVVVGVNAEKTSPYWTKKVGKDGAIKTTRHAEAHAIQLAQRYGTKIKEVLVLRWQKNGKLTMAKPCQDCQRRLLEVTTAKKIKYSDWQGEIQCLSTNPDEINCSTI